MLCWPVAARLGESCIPFMPSNDKRQTAVRWLRRVGLFVVSVTLCGPTPPIDARPFVQPETAGANDVRSGLEILRRKDRRVAAIGFRLAAANVDLCADRAWLIGAAFHDLSQYPHHLRDAMARQLSLNLGPAIFARVEDGPAHRAGLQDDDVILSIDGAALPRGTTGSDRGEFATMEHFLTALDEALSDGVAELMVSRGGSPFQLTVNATLGCASRFQVRPSPSLNAYADGRYVQITTALVDYMQDDEELAAALAHEFAHNLLRHRVRLNAAGIRRGILGNFGRNARLIRETETEADRLSVHLLDRAGIAPRAAIRFWQRFGRRGLNIFGSPTHGTWRQRVLAIEAEIAAIDAAKAAGRQAVPPFLEQLSRENGVGRARPLG